MKCPICKGIFLEKIALINELYAHSCKSCGGNWIRYEDYWKWRESNLCLLRKPFNIKNHLPVKDSTQAKICPDCGRILIKYRVDNSLNFYVEHCGNCNGMWFDKNEWENIKLNNLHGHIHSIPTKPWQKKIREEALRENLQDKYIKKFGRWDYERLKEMREWIYKKENRIEMLSYLLDEDPYKI